MPKSSQASVWKSLAIAFGDGIAFGVGLKLAQGQARAREQGVREEPGLVREERVEAPPARAEAEPARSADGLDLQVLDKVITALGARLAEHMGQVERRLADIEARVAMELREIRQAARTAAVSVDDPQIAALRAMMETGDQRHGEAAAALEHKLAALETVLAGQNAAVELRIAGIEAGLAAQIDQRAGALERNLRAEVQGIQEQTAAVLSAGNPQRLGARLDAVEAALMKQAAGVEQLRQRAEAGERAALDLIVSIGKLCEDAVRRIGAQPPGAAASATPPPGPSPEAPDEPTSVSLCVNGTAQAEAAAASSTNGSAGAAPDVRPLFTPRETGPVWPIPLVSTSVLAAVALAWLI